mmetsp:Transcript_27414/g.43964  ORF Transcript_27414/g.43964 Transcript_27414/m.43964 type:complete len:214 (+) Transcript_27414:443-1084(+)
MAIDASSTDWGCDFRCVTKVVESSCYAQHSDHCCDLDFCPDIDLHCGPFVALGCDSDLDHHFCHLSDPCFELAWSLFLSHPSEDYEIAPDLCFCCLCGHCFSRVSFFRHHHCRPSFAFLYASAEALRPLPSRARLFWVQAPRACRAPLQILRADDSSSASRALLHLHTQFHICCTPVEDFAFGHPVLSSFPPLSNRCTPSLTRWLYSYSLRAP